MLKRYAAALTAFSLLAPIPAGADYVIRDGQTTPAQQTFGSFSLSGVQFPKHVMVDPATGAAIGVSGNPLFTSPTQASTLATGQVSVGTTATQIVAARPGRRSVVILQEGNGSGGSGSLVRLGGSAVTTSTGVPLPGTAYLAFTIEGGAAVYGVVASGSQNVSFVEIY